MPRTRRSATPKKRWDFGYLVPKAKIHKAEWKEIRKALLGKTINAKKVALVRFTIESANTTYWLCRGGERRISTRQEILAQLKTVKETASALIDELDEMTHDTRFVLFNSRGLEINEDLSESLLRIEARKGAVAETKVLREVLRTWTRRLPSAITRAESLPIKTRTKSRALQQLVRTLMDLFQQHRGERHKEAEYFVRLVVNVIDPRSDSIGEALKAIKK